MFIRWITRLGQQDIAYSLVLAESRRVKGKPKQSHIAYLGGITDFQIEQLSSRCAFWDQVTVAFDRLANRVTPEDRKRFEAAIATKVPRPTAKQHEAYAREQAKHEAERKALEDALRPWRGNWRATQRVLDKFNKQRD
jgi:hypothetical protein